jgi:hypothetical protein
MILSSVISTALKDAYRIVKVLCLGKDDIREADEAAPFGIDSNPVANMIAVYAPTIDKSEAVIIGYLNAEQLAAPGEVRMYSTDADGKMKIYTWLKADGTMEIGGDADNMVRYTALNTAMQNFKTLINAELTKVQAGISGVGGAYVKADVSVDISAAKITEIKTL